MSNEKKNDGGPAFPTPYTEGPNDTVLDYGSPGLTIRDYFAAKAMQGISANSEHALAFGRVDPIATAIFDELAETSYAIADAMLKAREL